MTADGLLTVHSTLTNAMARIDRVRDLYLQEGETAAELCEAERLGARAGGIAYALTVIDGVLDGELLI